MPTVECPSCFCAWRISPLDSVLSVAAFALKSQNWKDSGLMPAASRALKKWPCNALSVYVGLSYQQSMQDHELYCLIFVLLPAVLKLSILLLCLSVALCQFSLNDGY